MASTAFDVAVDETDGVATLHLSGDVDRTSQLRLEEAYGRTGSGTVILDFTHVDYINSTGIAVIVGVLAKARAAGREMRAFGLSDHYRQIFLITRIADFMAIYEDESAAATAG